MRTAGARRFWRIEGYDSCVTVFQKTLPFGKLSEAQMVALLQRLAAKHLSDNEIVAASLRPNASGYAPLLDHRVASRATGAARYMISIGTNPHYVASIWRGYELVGSKQILDA